MLDSDKDGRFMTKKRQIVAKRCIFFVTLHHETEYLPLWTIITRKTTINPGRGLHDQPSAVKLKGRIEQCEHTGTLPVV